MYQCWRSTIAKTVSVCAHMAVMPRTGSAQLDTLMEKLALVETELCEERLRCQTHESTVRELNEAIDDLNTHLSSATLQLNDARSAIDKEKVSDDGAE